MSDISREIIDIFSKKLPIIFNSEEVGTNQVQMALDVADFLFNKRQRVMFVEAPVGTGKSLGLLVPTAIYAREEKAKPLYATATINLQNQIFDKDSVVLEKLGLLKKSQKILAQGMTNYICRTAFDNNANLFTSEEQKKLYNFFEICNYGLFSELYEYYPEFDKSKEQYLSLSNVKNYQCLTRCPGHNYRKKYSRTKNKLVITNHDQLIQSYFNTERQASPIVNFDNGVLIIDEAHFLQETFLGRLEQEIKFKDFPKPSSRFIKKYKDEYRNIWDQLNNLKSKYLKLTSTDSNMRISMKDTELVFLEKLVELLEENLFSSDNYNPYQSNPMLDKIENLLDQMNIFFASDKKRWLQVGKGLSFHWVTNKFTQEFYKMLSRLPKNSKVIFMSGTLTTGVPAEDIDINWNLRNNSYIYKKYPSAFNLSEQAIIYIPSEIAHPNSKKHLRGVSDKLPQLINLSIGGSLVLCTSNYYVAELSKYLKNNELITTNIYSQNEEDTQKISRNFKEDRDSILVGSGSFFTGFSIEGDSLNKLFLSKLPYPPHNDPFVELVSQECDEKEIFKKFIEPMMLKKLEQGLGRLIRSKSDSGFIAIFDSRIHSKSNAYRFIEALGYKITSNLEEVLKFVEQAKTESNHQLTEEFDEKMLLIPKIQTQSTLVDQGVYSKPMKKGIKSINTFHNSSQKVYIQKQRAYTLEDMQEWLKEFVKIHKNDTSNLASPIQYKRLKYPRNVYEKAVNFCHQKGIDYQIVSETFPFQNELQKRNFYHISPTVASPIKR